MVKRPRSVYERRSSTLLRTLAAPAIGAFLALFLSPTVLLLQAARARGATLLLGPQPAPKSYFWETSANLNEKQWKGWFRLPRMVYHAVLSKISDSGVFMVPANIGARTLAVEKQLGIYCLRAAGVTCLQIATLMDVSSSSVVSATQRVIVAINERYADSLHMAKHGPQKRADMKRFSDAGFPGARGIVDVCKIEVVVETDTLRAGNRHRFADRHQQIVQSYQFIVGHDYRILHLCGGHGGPVSDITIFYESEVYRHLSSYLEPGEFIMADMGYVLRDFLISGYRKNEIENAPSVALKNGMRFFNRLFSGTRNIVERCFGLMKARFPVLHDGMFFRERRWYSLFVKSLSIMHNLCLDYKDLSEAEVALMEKAHARLVYREKLALDALREQGRVAAAAPFTGELKDGLAARHRIALGRGASVASHAF